MKKILALLLALMMLASLVACSTKQGTPAPADTQEPAQSENAGTETPEQPAQPVHASVRDEKVAAMLQYLAENLTQPVSIDALAARFYVSKYHMMRRFKAETGYTIHSYLTSKRLMLARERIAAGQPATEVCFACGFRDYSTFARAYRKLFSEPPRAVRSEFS